MKRNSHIKSFQFLILGFLLVSVFCYALSMVQNSPNLTDMENDLSTMQIQSNSYAKEWNVTCNIGVGDRGEGVAVDAEGSIYIAGRADNGGVDDIFIAKYDSSGNQLWNQTWGSVINEFTQDIVLDSDKNIYVVGYREQNNDDILIVKFNSTGGFVWSQSYMTGTQDRGYAIAIDESNQYIYVAGLTNGPGMSADVLLVKYDLNGNQVWYYIHDTGGTDEGHDLAVQGDYIYVTGEDGGDALVMKHHKDNISSYVKSWAGPAYDLGRCIVLDSEGNIYIAGDTMSYGFGGVEIFLAKLDNDGNFLWNRSWGGHNYDRSYGITIDANDDIYIAAESESYGMGNKDFVTLKYDSDGNQPWSAIWGGVLLTMREELQYQAAISTL